MVAQGAGPSARRRCACFGSMPPIPATYRAVKEVVVPESLLTHRADAGTIRDPIPTHR
jgi:hypothetical protein